MQDNFSFIGFDPDNSLKVLAKTTLWNLESKAPSGAAKKAVINQVDDNHFYGELKFSTRTICLKAVAKAEDPESVLRILNEKLALELEVWNKKRHQIS